MMAKARRDGSNLWYQVKGKGDHVITLIGGFALVDKQFEFCDQFLEPHHKLLHWHYRGVGKSDWSMTEPYSVEGWVDDLAAILDHAGIKKRVYGAHQLEPPLVCDLHLNILNV